jgi:hypothetical protein
MGKKLALCCVRQRVKRKNLNLSNEVVQRELDSDFQKLNSLRGIDIRSNQNSSPSLRIANRKSNNEIMKPFWFLDVEVVESQDTVEVEFSDGHKETFENAEIWTEYPTLNPSSYGPNFRGVHEHGTGTLHFVDEDYNVVCGRFQDLDKKSMNRLILLERKSNPSVTLSIFLSKMHS